MGGAFRLRAVEVPAEQFAAVMTQINARSEVTHNYICAHRLKMWFVLAIETPEGNSRMAREIELEIELEIGLETGPKVFRFPGEGEFFIGFRVAA